MTITSFAEDQKKYCSDIYGVSCAPGDTKDLTGSAGNGVKQSDIDTTIKDALPSVTDAFRKKLQDPDQKYFKKIAMDVLDYSNSPECQFKDSKNIELCDQKVAGGLSNMAAANISKMSSFKNKLKASLEDVSLLQNNSNFREILTGLKDDLAIKFKNKDLEKRVKTDLFPEAKQLLISKI